MMKKRKRNIAKWSAFFAAVVNAIKFVMLLGPEWLANEYIVIG